MVASRQISYKKVTYKVFEWWISWINHIARAPTNYLGDILIFQLENIALQ